MDKVERIEQQIKTLSGTELAELRLWFAEFDWETWEQQLEIDVRDGRLDQLADEAIQEHAAGWTKPPMMRHTDPRSSVGHD